QPSCSIGFKRALCAIIDGNITTIIGEGVLIIVGSFGAAALKGFGITLLIGIILSLLSSLLLTRLLLATLRALTGNGDNVAKMYALKRKEADDLYEVDVAPVGAAVSGEVK
ncbi:MAG: hypothetical protein K2I79_03265, partial [Clostridia bacterium]|nr:hypothetical protein [Clostridia bacterium]